MTAPTFTGAVFVSDKPWSGFTAADYTPEQWKRACCLHRAPETEPKSNHGLPIREPSGALNRNGVHAAAARFNQVSAPAEAKGKAKSCLRGAYSQIGEEVPDVLKATAVDEVTFAPWDEKAHPRGDTGTPKGGRFIPKKGGGSSGEGEKPGRQRGGGSGGEGEKPGGKKQDEGKRGKDHTGHEHRGNTITIKRGDTLSQLAEDYGTTVDKIVKQNPHIKDPDLIYTGDDLKIPDDAKHPPSGEIVKEKGGEIVKKRKGGGTAAGLAALYAGEGRIPRQLGDYWTHGEGAAKIGWGTPGDFNRCRAHLAKYAPAHMLSGLCANLHKRALGKWPGQEAAEAGGHAMTERPCGCALTAAGYEDDFMAPLLDHPTPLTVTDDGRVYGHLAQWGVCHIGFDGQCVTPPHSMTGYAYFLAGEVMDGDGVPIPVGQLTLGGGHADEHLGWRPAKAHYDDTGAAVADITVGDDPHGIWFAGRLRPGVTDGQIAELRAAGKVSGDWRVIGGHLELVAALVCNVAGFPIPRLRTAVAAGRQITLVAAGVVTGPAVPADAPAPSVAAEVIAILDRRQRAAALQRKMGRDRHSRALAAAAYIRGGGEG